MTDSRVAPGLDRLPWLPDEPARTRGPSGNLLGWAALAILLVAGLAYWLGRKSSDEAPAPAESSLVRPEATVRLPDPAGPPPATAPQRVIVPKIEPLAAAPIPV